MVRLQGALPNQINKAVSLNELGNQIEKSMSRNVIERIFSGLLLAAGLGPNSVDDRWKSGKALQKIRDSRSFIFTEEVITVASSNLNEFVWYDSSPTYQLKALPKSKYTPLWEMWLQ